MTGAEGLPALQDAGNVLRPYTAFKLSLRLPPLVDAAACGAANEGAARRQRALPGPCDLAGPVGRQRLERAEPWTAGSRTALNAPRQAHFGASCGYIGQGGTIPLMNMLSQGFPKAQMMVCGVLGPKSNAHGPNEFLHVPYAKKLTAAVAQVIAAMAGAQTASDAGAGTAGVA